MILMFFRRKEYVITVDSRPGKGPGPAGHQGQAGAAARPPGVLAIGDGFCASWNW